MDAPEKDIIDCNCRGINPECLLCEGKGFYEREVNISTSKATTFRNLLLDPNDQTIPDKKRRGIGRIKKIKTTISREFSQSTVTIKEILLTEQIPLTVLNRIFKKQKGTIKIDLTYSSEIRASEWDQMKEDLEGYKMRKEKTTNMKTKKVLGKVAIKKQN